MGKPIPSEVGAAFEKMVGDMVQKAGPGAAPQAPAQPDFGAMLNGVNLKGFGNIKHTGTEQVAALNNDDMQRGAPGQGIVG